MSAIGSKNITNVVFDWQTENLPTPSGTGQLEGFELSRATSTATTRGVQCGSNFIKRCNCIWFTRCF